MLEHIQPPGAAKRALFLKESEPLSNAYSHRVQAGATLCEGIEAVS
jgi:hypothetical protein